MTTNNTDMEHHTIELGEKTWLEIEYEVDAGVEGSYQRSPIQSHLSVFRSMYCFVNCTTAQQQQEN